MEVSLLQTKIKLSNICNTREMRLLIKELHINCILKYLNIAYANVGMKLSNTHVRKLYKENIKKQGNSVTTRLFIDYFCYWQNINYSHFRIYTLVLLKKKSDVNFNIYTGCLKKDP